MNKSMRTFAAAGLAAVLMTSAVPGVLAVTTSAEPTQSGVYNLTGTGITIDAVTAENATIDGKEVSFYPGADQFGVTYTSSGTGAAYHMIFLLKEDGAAGSVVPTESNIYYINQSENTYESGVAVSFPTVYPRDLTSGSYGIYQTNTGGTGLNRLGGFEYYEYQPYKLGDVTGEGNIDASDAVGILRHAAAIELLTGSHLLAGDVNGVDGVDVSDAVKVLRIAAGDFQ